MPMRTRLSKTAVALLLVLAGCPTRFDPRAETKISTTDPEADHAYREARARLEVGDLREAEAQFAAFLQRYPNDPLAASARLGEARAALGLDQARKAKELAEPLATEPSQPNEPPTAEATRARARWLYGLALHKTGDWQKSRELLRPFVATIAPGDDAVELHAVLADDAAHLGDAEDALREYTLFFQGARAAEKLYLRDKVSELVGQLSAGESLRLWNTLPKDGLAAAYLGRRVAADRRAAGDEPMARAVLDESRGARERAGLEEAKPARGEAAQRTLGCLLPLSGKDRAIGEHALRGALLAADLLQVNLPSGLPIDLQVRDTGSDPARAEAAVEELAQKGVVAILGPPGKVESQMAVPKAEKLGVPFIELSPDLVRRGELIFKMVRAREQAAAALVRQAVKNRARTIAVLAPESTYGRAMAMAIADAARAAGARLVAEVHFPEASTTFIEPVRKLQAAAPDAILIPAPASSLALIAPQISASGLSRMPGVKPVGKTAALYATADGLDAAFVASTAKYLQGAVLAPVFYADQSDARAAAFLDRYRAAYGEEPKVVDALAYDAVRAARIALDHEAGAPSRAALASQLTRLGETGLTGELAFTASGERAGAPILYVVDGDTVHTLR
jgi:ABC-type branched-subunit amino acid transport system substrate-binding protein